MISTRHRFAGVAVALAALTAVVAGCGGEQATPSRTTTTTRGTTPPPPVNGESATDIASLGAAATEFDLLSNELKAAIRDADAYAGERASQMEGPAGTAAQAAFARFREAAQRQENELNDIAASINQSGVDLQGVPGDAGPSGAGGAAPQIDGRPSPIPDLLDQGSQTVRRLAPVWGGSGSDNYQVVQQRWDSTAAELNAALSDLANKIA